MRLKTKKRLINLYGALFLIAAVAVLAHSITGGSSAAILAENVAGAALNSRAVAVNQHVLTPAEFGDLLEIRLQGTPAESEPEPLAQDRPTPPQRQIQLPPSIELKGILYHPQYALAMFQLTGENQIVSCSAGEEIAGARVKRISADEVVLSFLGHEFTRKLEIAK